MLSKLGYYLFVKPISLLPFPLLYLLSDVLYLTLYKIFGYRKKVVWDNLSKCFPDLSKAELKQLMNKFYRHFCDLLVESVKLFSIRPKEIEQRFKFTNPEILDAEFDKGKSVILVGGHYNNWEILAVGINQVMKHQATAIYKPLSNPFYERLARSSRGRYGLKMIPIKDVPSFFINDSDKGTATIFGGDQSPTYSKRVYWTNFLNRETAVAVGTEKYAMKYNYPVYFGKIGKLSRGHYTFEVVEVCSDPSKTQEGEITKKHVKMLEEQILERPELWLWSHKRWKRVKKDGENLI